MSLNEASFSEDTRVHTEDERNWKKVQQNCFTESCFPLTLSSLRKRSNVVSEPFWYVGLYKIQSDKAVDQGTSLWYWSGSRCGFWIFWTLWHFGIFLALSSTSECTQIRKNCHFVYFDLDLDKSLKCFSFYSVIKVTHLEDCKALGTL